MRMQSSSNNIIRTEFAAAINQIASDRNIEPEAILEAIRQALISAYHKQYGPVSEDVHNFVELDPGTGESKIFEAPVLERDEETEEVISWDKTKVKEVTPAGFGRIAAQTAKQVVLQKIRESERAQVISDFSSKIGEIVSAQILRMDGRTVVLDIGRGQGFMPPEEQMRGEFYRINNRVSVLIKEIRETPRGKIIVVSRADKELVSKLFEREVPEVASGSVKIALISREAGVRTKLAVKSTQDGVDPVGSCVGQRGVRVQEVIRELNNEKLDIIPYTENPRQLLLAALGPAENLQIELDENTGYAVVTAPDDQLSLAIGRGGQNVRLAAKLTGFKITIKSASGDVQTKATGDEEYEIDTFEGLAPETRELLVEHKLTTRADLSRFTDKWHAFELPADQFKLLEDKVTVYDKEQAEYDALRSERNTLLDPVAVAE
ncbi:MAG: transcription termination/antitermination protein NusA [Candidatus Pacebacteria bacterium CG_4_10_14_0_8_um_filter_42_14]|nr:MAG: transcription termination/antitermination protein NusA [Candidatus Pacebacteria bacterium CG_4_10_14_0_8_um_filter_42_14]